jgi:hypothetical protein
LKQQPHNKRRASLHASGRSVDKREYHPCTARTRLPLGTSIAGKGVGQWRWRSRAGSGLIAMHRTPLRPAGGLGVSTIIATTAHTITTTEGAHDATTVTTTVTATGRRSRGARELSARTSRMRGSPHISGLQQMYLGITGTPTPACGSRTTGSRTRKERQTTS